MNPSLKGLAGDRIGKDDWCQAATLFGWDQLVHNVVRIQSLNAKLPEELGEQAFAAGYSTCQGNL